MEETFENLVNYDIYQAAPVVPGGHAQFENLVNYDIYQALSPSSLPSAGLRTL